MPAKWSALAPYLEACYADQGRIERTSMVDKAYDDGADDGVVDALDALGSRVFNSVDEAKAFLTSQGAVEE